MVCGFPSSKISKSSGCKSVTTFSPLVTTTSTWTRLVVILTTSCESISGDFCCSGGGGAGDADGCCANAGIKIENMRQHDRRTRTNIANPPLNFEAGAVYFLNALVWGFPNNN